MKTKLTVLSGILVLGASLHAGTAYVDLNFTQGSAGLLQDGASSTGVGSGNQTGDYISPYTGTVGGAAVTLYCDDFPDEIYFNTNGYDVEVTSLSASATTLDAQTRYGKANANTSTPFSGYIGGSAYPAGTTLYDEMAWLATQMQVSGQSTGNELSIQEAIWDLTDSTGPKGLDGATELSGNTFKNATDKTTQGYQNWMNDAADAAANNYSLTGYAAVNFSNWAIVTDTDSAGCTIGGNPDGNGNAGCTPGTAGTAGDGVQEFLAYSSSPIPTTGTSVIGTPEPASFFLIGSALLLGGLIGRRRVAEKSKI